MSNAAAIQEEFMNASRTILPRVGGGGGVRGGLGVRPIQDHPLDLTVGLDSPPDAWMETDDLEDLLPPCDYVEHDSLGAGPVAWVIHLTASPCGDREGGRIRLICDPCFQYLRSASVQCKTCGLIFKQSQIWTRVEPL